MAIRINGGQYVLKDDNNGGIYNEDNILVHKGSINYTTGALDIEFVSASTVYQDIQVDYIKNETNIALYKNLSTQEFTYDSTSLEVKEMRTLY